MTNLLYKLYIVRITCYILHGGALYQQRILIFKIHIENAERKSSHNWLEKWKSDFT